jgi:broad specificity phosphatase PhoE
MGNTGGKCDFSIRGKLSPRGHKQAAKLVGRLKAFTFDKIIVSPLERAIFTILPYLKAKKLVAEVWPELVEMRGRKDISTPLPPKVRFGGPVHIPSPAVKYITFPGRSKMVRLPPPDESYEEGQRRTALACEKIITRYGGKDVTLLVVSHACSGARMLEGLFKIKMDGRFQHDNVGMTLIEQKANGEFISRYISRV